VYRHGAPRLWYQYHDVSLLGTVGGEQRQMGGTDWC
jgi:hypothetical protein